MKTKLVTTIFVLLACCCAAQEKPTVTLQQLKAYQGLYEYTNNSTLKMAASPKDTILFAIINETMYKLTYIKKDLFEDVTQNKIQFLRTKKGKIAGFCIQGDTLKLLDKKVTFTNEMWYPRISNEKYKYQQPQQDHDGIITGNLENTGLDKGLLENMVQQIIDGKYPNIHSILIMKDNKLVFEEYFYDHHKQKTHELRSATKSFISALAGIALEQGYIKSKHESILSYFPEYTFKNALDVKKKITIAHLLTNQSGLDCDTYDSKAYGNETEMGFTDDWIQYSLDLPMADTPGGKGRYCSSNPIILGRIIEKATNMSLPAFAEKTLFKGLDIKNYAWHFKPNKTSAETFCQLNLTSRSMLKFGSMYMNNGIWNGEQVLSTDWVQQSWLAHTNIQGLDYGYLWWTKHLRADGVGYYGKLAQGNGGQKIYIFREQNLIVVTTAGHYNTQSPINEIVSTYILPAFNKK